MVYGKGPNSRRRKRKLAKKKKSLPITAIMLSCFVLGGFGIGLYAFLGSKSISGGFSFWESVEQYKLDLSERTLKIALDERFVEKRHPYQFEIFRLKQYERNEVLDPYIVRVSLLDKDLRSQAWISDKIDVVYVDRTPTDRLGNLRLISIKKHDFIED